MRRTRRRPCAGWGFVSCPRKAKNGAQRWLIFRYSLLPRRRLSMTSCWRWRRTRPRANLIRQHAQAFFAKYPESAKAIQLI